MEAVTKEVLHLLKWPMTWPNETHCQEAWLYKAGLIYKMLHQAAAVKDGGARMAWREDMVAIFIAFMVVCIPQTNHHLNHHLIYL